MANEAWTFKNNLKVVFAVNRKIVNEILAGMTPDEYLESRRIGETPPLHMS